MFWHLARLSKRRLRGGIGAILVLAVTHSAHAGSGPKCDWDQEAAIAKATLRLLEDNDDVADPAPASTTFPQTLTTNCGRGTELIDTLGRGVVRVPFANGQSRSFYPILMTDKRDGQWHCNKVKVYTACVTDSKVTPEGTFLTLKVDMTRNASEEVLKVEPNGNVTPPETGKYFALLPKVRVNRYDKTVDDGLKALEQAEKEPCQRGGACRSKKIVAAEKVILTALRHHRLGALPLVERRKDVRKFLADHRDLTHGRKALHQAIMLNEIGVEDAVVPDSKFIYASPFELVDAVLWNSAPSYGAHQIDIGSNSGKELGPFRSSLGRVVGRWNPESLKDIRDRTVRGKLVRPLENWGRTYPIALWADFYRVSGQLTSDLRSSQGDAEYRQLYSRFLSAGTGCMAVLRGKGGVFANSTFAQLYVIDVANQKGPGRAVALAQYAQSLTRSNSTAAIESKMVEKIMSLSSGADHRKDVERRTGNIARIATRFSDLSGAPESACDEPRYAENVPKI